MCMIPRKATKSSRSSPTHHFYAFHLIGAVPNATRIGTAFYRSTTEMTVSEKNLVSRFLVVHREKMRGLPICNTSLDVEAVGFRALDEHRLGVLVTPWFMNLILLPGDDTWSKTPDGATDTLSMPSEDCEFTICHDDELGTYLSAVLFRTVIDFPDQDTAIAVAEKVLEQLFINTDTAARDRQGISRRTLLTGMSAS